MNEFFKLPIFGVFITLLVFLIAKKIRSRISVVLLNPILIAIIFIILFLKVFNIEFDDYNQGGQYLSFFLGPSIVALGVLFYEGYKELEHNLLPFLFSVVVGGIVSIISVSFIAIYLNVPEIIIKSIAPKSVTTPIAIEITKIIGGVPEITAGVVIAVGILGNAFGPYILKLLGIKSKAAIGIALGTASHGIGTARALEEGKLIGAYSGLAMCVNGLLTALITPYLIVWILNNGLTIFDWTLS